MRNKRDYVTKEMNERDDQQTEHLSVRGEILIFGVVCRLNKALKWFIPVNQDQ